MTTQPSTVLYFAPFRLDVADAQVWREDEALELRPKTFAVLRYMAERSGRLVTKDELLHGVWGGTFVGEAVLKNCIRELRTALGDAVQAPRFIATVHRRGYRFIAKVKVSDRSGGPRSEVPGADPWYARPPG